MHKRMLGKHDLNLAALRLFGGGVNGINVDIEHFWLKIALSELFF
jgi:hypothetical protein